MEKIRNALNLKVLKANKYHEVKSRYSKLCTDEDRIIYTLSIMSEYNIVPDVCGDVKNLKDSEKFRDAGNAIFLSKPLNSIKCMKAFELYGKSIAYAPPRSVQLALAYANRSAVLFKMSKYAECIQDIDRALSLNYPDNLKAKIYVRKAECMAALNSPNIDKTIEEAQHWLVKVPLSDVNKKMLGHRLTTIKTSLSKTTVEKEKSEKCCKTESLPNIKSKNSEVSCASDAMAIKYNEYYGRHIVATRDIKPSEVLAVEKSYMVHLCPDKLQTHCSNCLEVSWANIPCEYCTYSMYCSEECRASEWEKYHDIECPISSILMNINLKTIYHSSLRLAIMAIKECNGIENLRAELAEVDSCNDPRTKGFSKDGILENDKYRSVYSLATNTEKRSVQDLFSRSLDASCMLYYLATRTSIFGSVLSKDLSTISKNADATFIGGLILRHHQIIPSNSHSLTEQFGLRVIERGVAVMPFFSLFNHSCDSNVLRYSKSVYTIMYAIYPIKKGEQILDNYGQHYALTPKHVRQEELLKQYYFECDCVPCKEDWPMYFQLKSYKEMTIHKADEAKIKYAMRKFQKFQKYIEILLEGDVEDKPNIIKDLTKMIQVLYNHAPMPCEEMNNVVEMLKHIYDLSGNRCEIPVV